MTISRSLGPVCLVTFALLVGCSGDKDKNQGAGLVADASAPVAHVDAGEPVDINKCTGCALAAQATWTFEGIYRDDGCTEPVAQLVAPACAGLPQPGPASLTYVDEVGGRKAGETANVTIGEQIAPAANRFRKTGKGWYLYDGAGNRTPRPAGQVITP